MLDLIERLEKSESGSRELDALIFSGLGSPLPSEFMGRGIDLEWQDDGSALFPIGEMRVRYTPPAYTTSLDAIVVLIGEKSPLRGPIALEMAGSGFCAIESTEPCQDPVTAWGNTPALAACIALLRALQTKEAGHDQ